jgi:hypothetical protein
MARAEEEGCPIPVIESPSGELHERGVSPRLLFCCLSQRPCASARDAFCMAVAGHVASVGLFGSRASILKLATQSGGQRRS